MKIFNLLSFTLILTTHHENEKSKFMKEDLNFL